MDKTEGNLGDRLADRIRVMDPHEKSVLLAAAMGWEVVNVKPQAGFGVLIVPPEELNLGVYIYDLYTRENMHIAWEAVEWVAMNIDITAPTSLVGNPHLPKPEELPISTYFSYWWEHSHLWAAGGKLAQEAWLNKVLELMVAAGVVELGE